MREIKTVSFFGYTKNVSADLCFSFAISVSYYSSAVGGSRCGSVTLEGKDTQPFLTLSRRFAALLSRKKAFRRSRE